MPLPSSHHHGADDRRLFFFLTDLFFNRLIYFFNRLIDSHTLPFAQFPMPHCPTQTVKSLHPPSAEEPRHSELESCAYIRPAIPSDHYKQQASKCTHPVLSVTCFKNVSSQLKDMGAIISSFHQERNIVKPVENYFARLLITEQVHVWWYLSYQDIIFRDLCVKCLYREENKVQIINFL